MSDQRCCSSRPDGPGLCERHRTALANVRRDVGEPIRLAQPEPVKHQRSSMVFGMGMRGERFCLGCMLPWPCPDAPADGSDGWDDE